VRDSKKVMHEFIKSKKYDDDQRDLDDFYFTTNKKDLQSNRNITPPSVFDVSDFYNEFFSQMNKEKDIQVDEKDTENA